MSDSVRGSLAGGRVALPTFGSIRPGDTPIQAWAVVDDSGHEVEPIGAFLLDLSLSDMSPLTLRSYGSICCAGGGC